jgi:hypothetical protein
MHVLNYGNKNAKIQAALEFVLIKINFAVITELLVLCGLLATKEMYAASFLLMLPLGYSLWLQYKGFPAEPIIPQNLKASSEAFETGVVEEQEDITVDEEKRQHYYHPVFFEEMEQISIGSQ